jgi:cholest-4-en-3-one 26-monooxygenase
MLAADADLQNVLVADRALWKNGPPHELFTRMRRECPVHRTPRITEFPEEDGFWSVTRFDDVQTVNRDWQTYSSERGGTLMLTSSIIPLEQAQLMFVAMDPPRHDRFKALFQLGFAPRRIAQHEDAIRAIAVDVLEPLAGRDDCDMVSEVAEPFQARVMGNFLGIPPGEDAIWVQLTNAMFNAANPEINPDGPAAVMGEVGPEVVNRCQRLIDERRERPTDDLVSVLVHAEIDGQRLEDHEIVMGFFLFLTAGFDSTKSTYCSAMRALLDRPDQRQLLLDDPSLIPGAIEETLRMFPPATYFRRTATRDHELRGESIREGDKVIMWYVSSNRDESHYDDPDRFDVTREPEHHAFGAGGRHFCLGAALARLELQIMLEETLARYPAMEALTGPDPMHSVLLNQQRTLRVRPSP